MPDYPRPESVDHLIRILSTFTNYEQMASFHSGEIRCGLETMERLVAALGKPHLGVPCIHITGSKGKGSTAIMTAALLRSAGLRCGVFTSPHLVDLRERIALDGVPLADEPLLRAADRVLDALRGDETLSPTFFEFITAAAMVAFLEARADVAVYEVGLGGRLDATNVVVPEAAVITNVELEHVPRLGTTVEEIAREKAGILKPGVPAAAFLEDGSGPRRVVEERAAACRVPLVAPGAGLELERKDGSYCVSILGSEPEVFSPPRPAALQARNAALALAAVHLLAGKGRVRLPGRPDPAILSRVRLPGRFEIAAGSPCVIVDGAHSPASLEAVAREARAVAAGGKLAVLFGMARDKDLRRCLLAVMPHADAVVFTGYGSTRSAHPQALRAAAGGAGATASGVARGLALAREAAGKEGTVLVTGSFYCAGEVKALLTEERRKGCSPA